MLYIMGTTCKYPLKQISNHGFTGHEKCAIEKVKKCLCSKETTMATRITNSTWLFNISLKKQMKLFTSKSQNV